jgi:hypothetical protein
MSLLDPINKFDHDHEIRNFLVKSARSSNNSKKVTFEKFLEALLLGKPPKVISESKNSSKEKTGQLYEKRRAKNTQLPFNSCGTCIILSFSLLCS